MLFLDELWVAQNPHGGNEKSPHGESFMKLTMSIFSVAVSMAVSTPQLPILQSRALLGFLDPFHPFIDTDRPEKRHVSLVFSIFSMKMNQVE